MMSRPIYLDYNATTPIAPEVAEAMAPYLYQHFGNPSSAHPYGMVARQAVMQARQQLAALLNCRPGEVVFTSGGTESNNLALKGVAWAAAQRGDHIITSAIEHPAVMEVCRWLAEHGFRLTILPVDAQGQINPADLAHAITSETVLVSIMHANNEVGTIQRVAELAHIAHEHGALMHTDAAQSLGKIPVDVEVLGIDLLSVAGHKLYAPKGIGALYVRDGVDIERQLQGAGHEGGRRPGTENVLAIVGLGKAAEIADRDLVQNMAHFQAMRDRLHHGLMAALGEDALCLNGHPEQRLPNTLSLGFRGVMADALLDRISDRVAASAGAACHADDVRISDVLAAMSVPLDWAQGTIRFSVGRMTVPEQIDEVVDIIAASLPDCSSGEKGRLRPRPGEAGSGWRRFVELRPDQLAAYLEACPVVFWPLGLIEHHSWHMPVGFDGLNAREICVRVARRTGGLLLPVMWWGSGGGHGDFMWTFYQPPEAAEAILCQTICHLVRFGFRIVVLLAGHYPWQQILERNMPRFEREYPDVLFLWGTAVDIHGLITLSGDHAAVEETSQGLATVPQWIDIEALRSDTHDCVWPADGPPLERFSGISFDPADPQFAQYGPDARDACIERGERTLSQVIDALVAAIQTRLASLSP